MHLVYINGIERSADIQNNTYKKTNQIQQRSDSMNFTAFRGTQPTENQDVKVYLADTVDSIAGAVITLKGYFEKNVKRFYAGQKIFLRIGETNQTKAFVQSFNETTLQLTLTAVPSITINPGDLIGDLTFGGLVTRAKNVNIDNLANLEYPTQLVDYTKIFDRKRVADSWQNVDARYIINDFCNTTVNFNLDVDNLSYASNALIQIAWLEGNDGGNPTADSSDYLEATSSGVFSWTFSGGTAKWETTFSARNYSFLTNVLSGMPIAGEYMAWVNPADYTKITDVKLRLGSSNVNYIEVTLPKPTANGWQYKNAHLDLGTLVGNPNWAAVTYAAIIITETASSSMKVNGLRVNQDNSFTLYNVNPSNSFTDFRSGNLKPTALMQRLAKAFSFVWFIDYERDINYVASQITAAPFSLSDNSANFFGLEIEVDQTNLGNSVIVNGGQTDSVSRYAQVIPGDNAKREWVLKNEFKNLEVTVDNGTSTHSAASGTTTTNIKIVAHGLASGDHVINRTRSNAVREITVVDADNFTVEAVPSQTSGDNITFFSITATVGIENLDIESAFDYLSNFERQSVRASEQTGTLNTTSFIRFEYNEKIPVQVKYTDSGSANALKALGFGDGIFDLDPIKDESIQDLATAIALAQAQVSDFKNPIINGSFKTDWHGLKAGQVIQIQDSNRGIDASFLIQVVKWTQRDGEFGDYYTYDVTFGTTLFGYIEFYQKLLASVTQISDNTNEIVETFATASEEVQTNDVNTIAKGGGFKTATGNEDVTSDDSNTVVDFPSGTWRYEPNGVGQPLLTRYSLCDFG